MNPAIAPASLRSPDAVDWVKDLDQVLIIDKRQRKSHLLQGEEAIVWGWLASSYPYSKIIHMLENLLALSSVEAQNYFQGLIRKWYLAGLLESESGEHG